MRDEYNSLTRTRLKTASFGSQQIQEDLPSEEITEDLPEIKLPEINKKELKPKKELKSNEKDV